MEINTPGEIMSDISVIGLGAMGGALAWALQKGGCDITVWNRSAGKMEALVANGAAGASSVVDAVVASPVILVCVSDYVTTRIILGAEEVVPHLAGRTLIQLSTGAPREVQECADWCNDCNIEYIDGAILCLPTHVGTDDAQILFAGQELAFEQHESLLNCLGGDLRYLGENVRAAATLDLAWLCQRLGMILGAVHGARLCESEDVRVDAYAAMFPNGDRVRLLARAIYEDNYVNPDVTVQVWNAVSQRLREQAQDAGINEEFPEFAAGVLGRAITAGYGEENVAALVKLFRDQ